MVTVTVDDLKDKLSECVARVKAGEEVTITEHGKVVAHVIPTRRSGGDDQTTRDRQAELEEMARQGLIKLGTGKLPKEFFDGPFPSVPGNVAVEAILKDREEARY